MTNSEEFIANVAHELRTPIAVIQGFAETLRDHPTLQLQVRQEVVEKIIRNCARCGKIVHSLVALSDAESPSQEPLPVCDLASLVGHCKALFLTAHPNATLQITNEASQTNVAADGDLVELVLMNLFENAVKYSTPPIHIEVFLSQTKTRVRLCVKDRGIGIPKAHLPHIFDRFYAVDKARSRKLGGAGLGLSLVKRIVEKYCGTVTVDSEEGVGSAFTLEFPIVPSEGAI